MFTKAAWQEAWAFAKTKYLFLLGHLAVALLFSFLIKFAGLVFLFGWEMGQARNEVMGSVKSPEKWWDMLKHVFTPIQLIQWLPQGIIAAIASAVIL